MTSRLTPLGRVLVPPYSQVKGMFWVKCSGSGPLLLNSFGAIYEVDVDGDYVVDTGHIVAFEDSLSFQIGKSNESWLGSFFGGEGLSVVFLDAETILPDP